MLLEDEQKNKIELPQKQEGLTVKSIIIGTFETMDKRCMEDIFKSYKFLTRMEGLAFL